MQESSLHRTTNLVEPPCTRATTPDTMSHDNLDARQSECQRAKVFQRKSLYCYKGSECLIGTFPYLSLCNVTKVFMKNRRYNITLPSLGKGNTVDGLRMNIKFGKTFVWIPCINNCYATIAITCKTKRV